MQKITPCLWFDDQAEEAANFYTSIFKSSKIGNITRYGKEGYEIHGREAGTVMTVDFEIEGQKFTALNGGPVFKFNEAISFVVHCETQKEVDSERSQRAMKAMLQMKKIDIEKLKRAYEGGKIT